MTAIKAILGLLIVVVIGIVGFAYSGLYNVAADEPHFGVTRWLLNTTMARSIAVRDDDIVAPDNLESSARIDRGAQMYARICAGCHLGPGVDPTAIHVGMKPQPPRLKEHIEHHAPANLFWIIKHGIKMSGMPALGLTFDDNQLWDLVAFLQTLPELDAQQYRQQTAGKE
ncbi:cytochrome c [Allohahella marinimesophila]|uniref:Cytochrome c domain-containing protein n=1 Tax=Allohahella marinimesophila TaxID=1054972 RepID=A0ABP7Q6B4_9GAMM